MNDEQLTRIEQKIDAVYASAEKTRKYLLTMVIATAVTIALPILLALFLVPMVMSSLGGMYSI
jgi:hypothetical protein